MIKTEIIKIETKGNTDIVDITGKVQEKVKKSGMKDGIVTVFVSGSTAGVTTIEYEPGLVKDLKEMFERIVPSGREYHHDRRWGDGNGFSHVRASLLKAGLSVPFENGELTLGTWQQIVLIDFDNRFRSREIVVKILGT